MSDGACPIVALVGGRRRAAFIGALRAGVAGRVGSQRWLGEVVVMRMKLLRGRGVGRVPPARSVVRRPIREPDVSESAVVGVGFIRPATGGRFGGAGAMR